MSDNQQVPARLDDGFGAVQQSGGIVPSRFGMAGAGSHGNLASQSSMVEQSRAIAEVQAAVVVAQQVPRSESRALAAADVTCSMVEVAERAFFKYSRGGETITGPTIHLAVELARVWGNIKYGLRELSRDDMGGQSEMLAYAWDVQTNSRSEVAFIVPHIRDKKGGGKILTEQRDIYENNANAGARRLREMIFRVLPPFLTERAKARCLETLQKGGGKAIVERRADAIAAFEKIGVSRSRLEGRQGKADTWTDVDLANLHITFKSLQRNELTIDDAFPEVDETGAPRGGVSGLLANASAPAKQQQAAPAKQPAAETAPKAAQAKATPAKAAPAKAAPPKAAEPPPPAEEVPFDPPADDAGEPAAEEGEAETGGDDL